MSATFMNVNGFQALLEKDEAMGIFNCQILYLAETFLVGEKFYPMKNKYFPDKISYCVEAKKINKRGRPLGGQMMIIDKKYSSAQALDKTFKPINPII